MEYVFVDYPVERDVHRGGSLFGRTRKVLDCRAGKHTFDLNVPLNYTPLSQRVDVGGTSPLSPMLILFRPKAAAVATTAQAGTAARRTRKAAKRKATRKRTIQKRTSVKRRRKMAKRKRKTAPRRGRR